ncbi:tyrosine recombinase XerC [Kitasatospora sp. NPDC050543]|uniref:tyrosine recombinase XerC n=1 Tax=Kitasatospora sp. NPDC050543 TaxID=3364054 RepID=UPI0037933AD6
MPPVLRGQLPLFDLPRQITAEHLNRIADRTWPEWDLLVDLVVRLAGERGVSDTWDRGVRRRLRFLLSLRDAEGEDLVAEEFFDQVPGYMVEGAAEVLRRAGLLRLRAKPRISRWPTGSCGHCGCWGVTRGLCRGCETWKSLVGRYPVGPCTRCGRSALPLSAKDRRCRGCSIHVREHGSHDDPAWTQLQIAINGRTAVQLKNEQGSFGYDPDERPRRARERERDRRRKPERPLSAHLVDPDQGTLFALDRDWARVGLLSADQLPVLTGQAERLLADFTRASRGQSRLVDPNPHGHTAMLRALRIVVAWLGVAAPIRERDLRTLAALDNNISGQRVIWFLAEQGLLEPDPSRHADIHMPAIEAKLRQLPAPMAEELRCWVKVLKGQGRLQHPTQNSQRIRTDLGRALPVLQEWAGRVESLREITPEDFTAALKARQGSQARSVHYVFRSIFRALRQERLIFRDPTRGISLPAVVTLPNPLPSDQLAGLLERARGPLAQLLVALVAVHAVPPSEAAQIRLGDVDLARGRLVLRRGYRRHTVYLDALTVELIGAWLRERRQAWPTSSNPYLLVSSQTALDIAGPPISGFLQSYAFKQVGTTARALWQDRLLFEAQQTADPLHLMRLFGVSDSTAMKYVHAAHPHKAVRPLR